MDEEIFLRNEILTEDEFTSEVNIIYSGILDTKKAINYMYNSIKTEDKFYRHVPLVEINILFDRILKELNKL